MTAFPEGRSMADTGCMSRLTKEQMRSIEEKLAAFIQSEPQIASCFDSAPVDIFKIASNLGFGVFPADLPEHWEGFISITRRHSPGGKTIVFDSKLADDAAHVRFIVAHELGHYISARMSDRPTDNMQYISKRNMHRKERVRPQNEQEVDYLAAAMLMPKKRFEAEYRERRERGASLQSIILELAELFAVEDIAVIDRLDELELISAGD